MAWGTPVSVSDLSDPGDADSQAAFAATLVDEWVRGGVTHAVVCPGSRSTPLALALAAHPGMAVHVRLDERSAGFTALGIGLATGPPGPGGDHQRHGRRRAPRRGGRGRPGRGAAHRLHRRPTPRAARRRGPPDHRPGPSLRPVGAVVRRSGGARRRRAGRRGGRWRPGRWPRPDPAGAARARSISTCPSGSRCSATRPHRGATPGRPDGGPWHQVASGPVPPPDGAVDRPGRGGTVGPGRRGVIVAGAGCGDPAAVLALAAALGLAGAGRPPVGAAGAGARGGGGRRRHPPLRALRRPATVPEVVLRLGEPWVSKVVNCLPVRPRSPAGARSWWSTPGDGGRIPSERRPTSSAADPRCSASPRRGGDWIGGPSPDQGAGWSTDGGQAVACGRGGRPGGHRVRRWARSGWPAAPALTEPALAHRLFAGLPGGRPPWWCRPRCRSGTWRPSPRPGRSAPGGGQPGGQRHRRGGLHRPRGGPGRRRARRWPWSATWPSSTTCRRWSGPRGSSRSAHRGGGRQPGRGIFSFLEAASALDAGHLRDAVRHPAGPRCGRGGRRVRLAGGRAGPETAPRSRGGAGPPGGRRGLSVIRVRLAGPRRQRRCAPADQRRHRRGGRPPIWPSGSAGDRVVGGDAQAWAGAAVDGRSPWHRRLRGLGAVERRCGGRRGRHRHGQRFAVGVERRGGDRPDGPPRNWVIMAAGLIGLDHLDGSGHRGGRAGGGQRVGLELRSRRRRGTARPGRTGRRPRGRCPC